MPGVRVTATGHHELGLTWSGLLARVGWAAGADAVHDQLAGDESAATVEPDRSVVLGHHRDGEVRDACANQRAVNGVKESRSDPRSTPLRQHREGVELLIADAQGKGVVAARVQDGERVSHALPVDARKMEERPPFIEVLLVRGDTLLPRPLIRLGDRDGRQRAVMTVEGEERAPKLRDVLRGPLSDLTRH